MLSAPLHWHELKLHRPVEGTHKEALLAQQHSSCATRTPSWLRSRLYLAMLLTRVVVASASPVVGDAAGRACAFSIASIDPVSIAMWASVRAASPWHPRKPRTLSLSTSPLSSADSRSVRNVVAAICCSCATAETSLLQSNFVTAHSAREHSSTHGVACCSSAVPPCCTT